MYNTLYSKFACMPLLLDAFVVNKPEKSTNGQKPEKKKTPAEEYPNTRYESLREIYQRKRKYGFGCILCA